MPESQSERFRRSVQELDNFAVCGDARGVDWLDHHPADKVRAAEQLRAYRAAHDPNATQEEMTQSLASSFLAHEASQAG